ncbi:MAG: hypothetical protein WAM14_17995 [Candidatus Nitrosopolaris sp.]
MVTSAKLLDDAYRTEKNGDVRERLLLVSKRFIIEKSEIGTLSANISLLLWVF